MDSSSLTDLLQNLETSEVIGYLQALDLQELVSSPYFLGGVGVLAVVALLMRWRLLLVTVLSISGFAWLLSYTLEQGPSLGGGGVPDDTMALFVGGGAVIVFVAIYFLFIRGE